MEVRVLLLHADNVVDVQNGEMENTRLIRPKPIRNGYTPGTRNTSEIRNLYEKTELALDSF